MSREVIVEPVSFASRTPQKRFPTAALPEPMDPSALSAAVPVPKL
jgi:hypothetical protein